jgi:SAM-dependent methyltransferase
MHCGPVYQDLVLSGRTVAPGTRDCAGRWKLIAPHLDGVRTLLDVGSNLGWFGLQISSQWPECLVASVEPDEKSAALQRQVLASNSNERILLLTSRATAAMARRFVEADQIFDAVLCLAVLHWLPEHRQFLSLLGNIARKFLIEQPDPRESGAGFESVRQAIGPIGPYLESLFPDRPRTLLARYPSHRDSPYLRELWLVDETAARPRMPVGGLDISALLDLSPSWPPRTWWQRQLQTAQPGNLQPARLLATPTGWQGAEVLADRRVARHVARRIARLPEQHLLSRGDWVYRRLRRLAGSALRSVRLLPTP